MNKRGYRKDDQEGQISPIQDETELEVIEAQKVDEWVKKMNGMLKEMKGMMHDYDPVHPSEISILESTLIAQTRLTIHWMVRAQKAERQLYALLVVKRN